jgi:ribosomal protein S18 acetylase RimI-like enzyme
VTAEVTVVSAFAAGRGDDAAALVFEYMAATQARTGQEVPAGIGELPAVLQRECRSLQAVYRPPGALLIADHDGQPVGCVGLASWSPERTAEIKRLYVKPAYRGKGIARILMSHAHFHAAQHGITRLILDVLPARTAVIGFYRSLDYTETGPYPTPSPVPMIYMERPITSDDTSYITGLDNCS